MWWLALWFSSAPMTVPEAFSTLTVDSSAYVVAVDTRQATTFIWNQLPWDAAFEFQPSSPASFYKLFRMKEQSVTFPSQGVASLRLKAGSSPVFPIVWNLTDPAISPSTSAHYFVAPDSTTVMREVAKRHWATGESVKVYWGNEWKLEPQLWVKPK